MERQVILTKDGSSTVHIPAMDVTYHSHHGAIQESQHVFIQAGLIHSRIFEYIGVHRVLEIGFGTGLNALLTLLQADKHQNRIYYTAIEPFPLTEAEVLPLNYCEQLQLPAYESRFHYMHACGWDEMYEISEFFRLTKINLTLADYTAEEQFSIIYFDAFAPSAQPELWTKEVFEKMYALLIPGGILVTYCSKGEVRRNMQAAGFIIEKIPGPPGKREMVRAKKFEV